MNAGVWTALSRVECLEWPDPIALADEVIVKVAYCGFCGSDASIVEGRMVSGQPPRVLGHEVAGTVASIGADVQGIEPGTAVACNMWRYCGRCSNCHAGRAGGCTSKQVSASGFAEYAVYRPEQLYPLPRNVSLKQATLADPLATCLHAAELAALRPGEDVLVIGGGALGLLMVQVAALRGASTVVLCSSVPSRRELATTLGATAVLDPSSLVDDLGRTQTRPRGGFDVVFEAAGISGRLQQALKVLNHAGRLVIIGGHDGQATVSIPPNDVQNRELRIVGSLGSGYSFGTALLVLPRVNTDVIITAVEPLSQIAKVYANHRVGLYVRALVQP
jgi:L-iditol 2-dehydrogenase